MMIRRCTIGLVMIAALLLPTTVSVAQGPPDFVALITHDRVMQHVEALAVDIGARPMGSPQEAAAADYVAAVFEELGYDVEIQEFRTRHWQNGSRLVSRNVIASRLGDDQIVVIGAHLDSVTDGTGAGDNASGVAAILAVAEALQDFDTAHTLVFVAFGAEENGDPSGAKAFVESLGDDIDHVIAMINVDSVGMGTTLNVYAGAKIGWSDDEEDVLSIRGGPTWVRDLALTLAGEMGLPVGTSPDETWGGYTGDWSDHYAFVLAGVPIVYVEAWQWEDVDDLWWGQETAEGDVMHTRGDIIENVVPEKVEMAAELIAATAYAIANGARGPE